MEKTELIKGQKYRIVTRWGEAITKFWGVDEESGNPFFVVHEFPIMMMPWAAILEMGAVPMDSPEKHS
jgi:hypothetical protein